MSRRWMLLIAFLACCSAARGKDARAVTDQSARDDDIARLILRLGQEDFRLREEAEGRLWELGRAAVDPLAEFAVRGDPEIARSAIALLERMFVDGCITAADDAERALERLSACDSPGVSRAARSVLTGNQQLRERRAVAAIRELRGKVDYNELNDLQMANFQWGWNFSGERIKVPGLPPAVIHVWLLKGWEGGEEGLWHIRRLEHNWSVRLWGIQVTNVQGSGVTTEAVQSLAARLPNLAVHERGPSLGIRANAFGPCVVSDVLPDGAANRAGIQDGDEIIAFDGVPVESFNDLVGQLMQRTPEEEVELKVIRGGRLVSLPVTLLGWREVHTGHRDPPPVSPKPEGIFVPSGQSRER